MVNTAPQTNEPGAFDSDGLPIHGLVIPGQATIAGVFGGPLITDPTSSDQGTVQHVPLAFLAVGAQLDLASGATLAGQIVTLSGTAGRTTYLTQITIDSDTATTAFTQIWTLGGMHAPFNFQFHIPLIVGSLHFSRVFNPPLPASGLGANVTLTAAGAGTTNAAEEITLLGFAL